MDNLCHTLTGLALGEAGLKRTTALAIPTLLVGANVPDLDILAYAWGPVEALGFRRGWTHGIIAMAVWPVLLAGVMFAIGTWQRRRAGTPVRPSPVPLSFRGLLLLAALGVWSHPLLDLLNTYGVRLLMPFSGRWFYGDTLFIVDVWVWAALAVGVVWSRARERGVRDEGRPGVPWDPGTPARPHAGTPVRVAIALVLVYIGVMAVSASRMRARVHAAMHAHAPAPLRAMVAPVPLDPLRRQVVLDLPDLYAIGTLRLPSGRFGGEWVRIPKHDGLPAARAAAASATGRTYLRWARFPFYAFGEDCAAGHVCIRDARYFPMGWAEVAVPVGGTITLGPSLPPGTTP
jgi:inner membrane protein